MRLQIAVNDSGHRVGESHHNARLTDAEVDVVRTLHGQGLSYRTLADKFDVSKRTIAAICRYERRAEVATRWKTIEVRA